MNKKPVDHPSRILPWAGMVWLVLATCGAGLQAADGDPEQREAAYRHLRAGEWEAAVRAFTPYVRARPQDLQAGLDYVHALEQLGRFPSAADWLANLRERFPERETLRFKLGVAYANMNRFEDARAQFEALEDSTNADLATAAREALERLEAEHLRGEQWAQAEEVYRLAAEGDHAGVVEAVNAMEAERPLPSGLAMQRLYALYNLEQYDTAMALAETLATRHPGLPELALMRAELRMKLGRPDEALSIWKQLEERDPMTPAAQEAQRRRLALQGGDPGGGKASPEEDRIYALAREERHQAVVEAVEALSARAQTLSPGIALQRLYALYALERHEEALARLNNLPRAQRETPEIRLLQAELMVQLDRREAARSVLQAVEAQAAGTPVAEEAARRRRALEPAPPGEEDAIYALAREGRHAEVVEAIEALEEPLSQAMQQQRLYALQALGRLEEALERSASMMAADPADDTLALLHANLLFQAGHWKASADLLHSLAEDSGTGAAAETAREQLRDMPGIVRPDKWYWGEAWLSGDFFGRFGEVVGSGLVRHGAFTPGARWLQPYGEFRFGVDTEGGIDGERSRVADNHVGFYGGVRLQVLEKEYLFLYAQGGVNKDLLDAREEGDWAYDYQAGVYAFKALGPGTGLKPEPDHRGLRTAWEGPGLVWDPFWRGDWFIDGGLDFSYYHRHASAIGYGQAHQGFRLFQVGPTLGFDTYVVENVAWDIKGNYFDNLVEVGPGARFLWSPCRHAEVILRAEWLSGFYLGRDDEGTRGDAAGQYDEARVGLSVGMRW